MGSIDVTIQRTIGNLGAVSVQLDTSDSTASAGTDYTAVTANIINFADGDTTDKIVTIPILDDVDAETIEYFTVGLSNPTGGATLGSASTSQIAIISDEVLTSPENDSCFIATAAYGSSMYTDVRFLRAFRDDFLLNNTPGKTFVSMYYRLSPPVANFIRKHEGLRAFARVSLSPLVWLSRQLANDETLKKQYKS